MLVDSHCHLDFPDFQGEVEAVVARACEAGIGAVLTISTRLDQVARVIAVAEAFPNVWCSVGTHPHESAAETVTVELLLRLTRHPKVIGIGETGLDYHYDHSPRVRQSESFRIHVEAAKASGLPLIVHTRGADNETIAALKAYGKGVTGVIHCFSTSRTLAEEALALGFFISLSGIVTFKKAEALREVVRDLPLDRLLVETDAPYLAPVPMRGKRNEPLFVTYTAALVAELKGVSPEVLAAATTRNFFRLFAKATPPEGRF